MPTHIVPIEQIPVPQMVDRSRNIPNSSPKRFLSAPRPFEIMSSLHFIVFEPLHSNFKFTINSAKKKYIISIQNPVVIQDRKSTRLNSSHLGISYAVFCLKKK